MLHGRAQGKERKVNICRTKIEPSQPPRERLTGRCPFHLPPQRGKTCPSLARPQENPEGITQRTRKRRRGHSQQWCSPAARGGHVLSSLLTGLFRAQGPGLRVSFVQTSFGPSGFLSLVLQAFR